MIGKLNKHLVICKFRRNFYYFAYSWYYLFMCCTIFKRVVLYLPLKNGFLVSLTHSSTVFPLFVLQVLKNR